MVSTPAEHESGINKMLRRQLEGLHVDFCEIFNFDLEIGFNGVLRHGEHKYQYKNSHDVLLRVYASIFQKITNLSLNLEIGYMGVLRRQETNTAIKNLQV